MLLLQMMADALPNAIDAHDIAVVIAHPDDETIGCGALLSRLKNVSVICITDGAPRDGADASRAGFDSPFDYARVRSRELRAALAVAGVGNRQVVEFGVYDREVCRSLISISERLALFLEHHAISTVLTHAFEGGHPDHDGVAACVHVAATLLQGPAPTLIEMPFYHPGAEGMVNQTFSDGEDGIVAVLPPAQREIKAAMMAAHASQAHVLKNFCTDRERYRIAKGYNFESPPNQGKTSYSFYESGVGGQEEFLDSLRVLVQANGKAATGGKPQPQLASRVRIQLSQLRERVRSAEEEVVAERGRADTAENRLRAVEASTTWRATAPLRAWFSTHPTLTHLTRRTATPVRRLLQRQPGGARRDSLLADKVDFDPSNGRPWEVPVATWEVAPALPPSADPGIRPASSGTQRLNYYSSAGPDSRDYWPLFEECPCDIHFREYLALKDICERSIFHFGTGVHHFVGLSELERKVPNYIIAVTASPQEHAEFVRLIIDIPALSCIYKVLFTDIYTMNDHNLPDFDMITLFHLCEYWDPIKSAYAPLNDKTLLDLMIRKLRPGGKIAAYPRSRTWEKARPLFEAAVEAKVLAVDDQFKTLQFYARN